MENNKFSLSKKVTLLFFFFSFLFYHTSYSQCATGDPVQNFCAIDNKTVADLVFTTGINVVWFDALTGGNQYPPATRLINGKTYYALDIDPSCTDTTRFPVMVNIYGKVPTDVDVFVGKCASEEPTIAELSATAPGIIEWYSAQTGGAILANSTPLANGTTYWVQQTENGCTSSRLPTTVNLIDPPTPTVAPIQSFCSPPNPTVADLQAVESNIVWYDSETSTIPLNTSTALIHGEDYWATQNTFPCESTIRIQTTVQIDTAPNAGTNGSYTECELNLVTTNLFDLLGGSPDMNGTWTGPSALSGGYLGTFEPGVNTEGTYTYTVSSALGICPNETATVSVLILIVPPPTITNSNQSFCEIDNPTVADLSATGTGVLWYDTETSSSPLSTTDILIDGKDYWATQTETSGCESATRIIVTATIIAPLPPTTTEANQAFCDIDNPTVANLTASGTSILWYDTQISTTPLATTDALIDGEDYWATQTETSGCESASRLVVTANIITPLPPTTSEVNQTFCNIDNPTIADLSVIGTGILWYDTQTSTIPLATTDALIDGEDYWASQTEVTGCESNTRLVVTATIITPLPPTTVETTQTFCEIDNPTVANLTATGTGILWYDTETSTTPLSLSEALIDTQDYWASQTEVSGCESATRLVVTVTITKPLPPTTSEANQTFCDIDNPTVADLAATGTGVLWYATQISTIPLNTTDALISGEDYWATQTDASGCESATRLVVTVTIQTPIPPTTSQTNQTFCEIENPTVMSLSATGSGILWYDTAISTTPLATTDALIDGADYWASQTDALGCESISRLVVTVTILIELPPTTIETTQTFCEIDKATVGDLAVTGTGVLWYDTETSTTALATTEILVNGADYWATQTSVAGCESNSRLVVTASIIAPLPPTTSQTNQSFCVNDYLPNSPTIADLNVTGTNVLWYDSETSTIALNTTDNLVNGQAYWASQTDVTGCESATRMVVNVSIVNPPIATTLQTTQTFCLANNPTIAGLQVTGDTVLWFSSETSTTVLSAAEALVDGNEYWALNTDTNTGCESISRLMITARIIDVAPPVINNPSQTFCASDEPTVADLQASGIVNSGSSIEWYALESDNTPLNRTELLVHGSTYWAAVLDSTTGCTSSVRVSVNVVLTDPGTPILDAQGNEFCIINNPTLADLDSNISSKNSGTITWYDAYPNGSVLSLSQFLIDGETYYAVETDSNSCSSINPLAVTVDLYACDEYDIVIFDGFSPNGDGINDTFSIENLRVLYPDFKVEFFNRWGNLMYTSDANRPDWNGRLNGDDNFAPSGVYYFIINFNKENRKPTQGRLYLSR